MPELTHRHSDWAIPLAVAVLLAVLGVFAMFGVAMGDVTTSPTPQGEEDAGVWIDDRSGESNETIELAMETNLSAVHGYQISLSYNQSALTIDEVVGEELPVDAVTVSNGSVLFTGAQTDGVDEPLIATLEVRVTAENASETTLSIDESETAFNDDESYLSIDRYADGTVDVVEPLIYELSLANDGGASVVGLPGQTTGTLGDLLPEGLDGIDAFYRYTTDGWVHETDMDHEFDPLETLVVVTSDAGPETISVEVEFERGVESSHRSLDTGWQLVPAPRGTDAEQAFGELDATIVLDRYSQPDSSSYQTPASFGYYLLGTDELGEEPPAVSPFTGYFVHMGADGTLDPAISDVQTKSEVDESLGLEE